MRLYFAMMPDPEYVFGLEAMSAASWGRTTVSHLIKEVENSDTDPALIVSEFIKKADRQSGMIFRVAYETAVDLYDYVFL
jgi:hypothetical protein